MSCEAYLPCLDIVDGSNADWSVCGRWPFLAAVAWPPGPSLQAPVQLPPRCRLGFAPWRWGSAADALMANDCRLPGVSDGAAGICLILIRPGDSRPEASW